MKKTLVVKRKPVIGRGFGKMYGKIVGQGFKANPPSVVKADIQQQIEQLIQIPEDNWRWWQLSNDLIIEKSPKDTDFISSPTFYYLPQRRWKVVQHRSLYFGEEIDWSVHIGDITYEPTYGCWLFTDLFSDIIIRPDNRTHSVLDLDELAEVFEGGLITQNQLVQILRDTQALIDLIRSGNFPPAEIEECQRIWIESANSSYLWNFIPQSLSLNEVKDSFLRLGLSLSKSKPLMGELQHPLLYCLRFRATYSNS